MKVFKERKFAVGFVGVCFLIVGINLYANGYFDDWSDKKPDLRIKIREVIGGGYIGEAASDEEIEKIADCVADSMVVLAEENNCPLDGRQPAFPQYVDCVSQTEGMEEKNSEALYRCAQTVIDQSRGNSTPR